MIICKACGQRNTDGEEFCASCGRYLEWAGERVETPEVPEPQAPVEAEPEVDAHHGIVERVRSAVGLPVRPVAGATTTTEAPRTPAPSAPAPDEAADVAESEEAQSSGSSAASIDRSLALRRPTEGSAGAPLQRRRPPAFGSPGTTTVTGVNPDDVSCPVCHLNNAKGRTYCRHCGTNLAEYAAPVPDYRRIGFFRRHFSRDVEIVPVGGRPGKWGKAASAGTGSERYMRILGRLGAIAVSVGLILSFIGPVAQPIRTRIDSAYNRVIRAIYVSYTQQFAVGATASSAFTTHPAGFAVDDLLNDYWLSLPSKRTHGAGQWIQATFAVPTTLDYLGLLSGAGPTEQNFLSESRPKDILITFSNGLQKQETLQDKPAFQRLNIHVANVTSVRLEVLSVYPSATGNAVAISEIEFFQRS